MTDPTRPDEPESTKPSRRPSPDRRWVGPLLLSGGVLIPIGILIFSNLDATEVSWAGFRFNQPLWAILVATFLAGMVGSKVFGWGWRRWRRRRKRLKEELGLLRKLAEDTDQSGS